MGFSNNDDVIISGTSNQGGRNTTKIKFQMTKDGSLRIYKESFDDDIEIT